MVNLSLANYIEFLPYFYMELSEKKIEQLLRQPIIESRVTKSKDGKWVIHRTTMTDIKPVKYLEAVMNGIVSVE
ncbi:hypothetical protein HOE39_01650 [Candidatus Woesearchaeota archaeon]|nr:hypothetical protein [Candidatus Woesearchaeota archaeon]